MRYAAIIVALVPVAAWGWPVIGSFDRFDSGDGGLLCFGLAIAALIARRRRGLPESVD